MTNNVKRNVLFSLLIGSLFIVSCFLTALTFSVISKTYLNSAVQTSEQISDNLPDGRLSYKYLKDVTVEVYGTGIEDAELFGFKLGPQTVSWMGTGVIFKVDADYTYIITNAHVVGQPKESDPIKSAIIYVKNEEQKQVAEIVAVHDILDVAIIKIKGTIINKRVMKGFDIPTIQEKVYMTGHGLADPYIYTEGVFSGYHKIWQLYQLPVLPGNSGSGIFNKDGKMVGLVFAGREVTPFQMDTNYALAIDATLIKIFIEQLGLN